jgi:segregation and condensation protein B
MDAVEIKHFIEAALLAAGRPLNVDQLQKLFDGRMAPEKSEIRQAIATLNEEYESRGILVAEVASGYRVQVKARMADQLQKLWEERPPRYSRALFETLALVAYRQPITRGEIEDIRGVSVSPNIVRTLAERDWIRVVGHRDVPGRPEMFGTTKAFLDYFGLKKLDDLPPLAPTCPFCIPRYLRKRAAEKRKQKMRSLKRRSPSSDQLPSRTRLRATTWSSLSGLIRQRVGAEATRIV